MRKAAYEASRTEGVENLLCIGSKSAIIWDPKSAGEIDRGSHLRLWRGDTETNLWIDKSDVRNELESIHIKQLHVNIQSSSSTQGLCDYMLDDDETSYFEDLVMERFQDLLDFKEENLQFDHQADNENESDEEEVLLDESGAHTDPTVAQPFSWGYQSNRTEHWVRPEREPYLVPAIWDIKDDVKLPMIRKQFDVIVHTVKNIRLKGPQFEIFLKLKQSDDNPLFDFLNPECDLNGLFEKMKSIPNDVFQAGFELPVELRAVSKADLESFQTRESSDDLQNVSSAAMEILDVVAPAVDAEGIAVTDAVDVVEDGKNALSLLGNIYGDSSCSEGDVDDEDVEAEGEGDCIEDRNSMNDVAAEEGDSEDLLRSSSSIDHCDNIGTNGETGTNDQDQDERMNVERAEYEEEDDEGTASTASFDDNNGITSSSVLMVGEIPVSRDMSSIEVPNFATQELEACELEEVEEVEEEIEGLLLTQSSGYSESDGEYIATQDFATDHSRARKTKVEVEVDIEEDYLVLDGKTEKPAVASDECALEVSLIPSASESELVVMECEGNGRGKVKDSEEVFQGSDFTSVESTHNTGSCATEGAVNGNLDYLKNLEQEEFLSSQSEHRSSEGAEERNTVTIGLVKEEGEVENEEEGEVESEEEGEVESEEEGLDALQTSDTETSTMPSDGAVELDILQSDNSDLNNASLAAERGEEKEGGLDLIDNEQEEQEKEGGLDLVGNEQEEQGGLDLMDNEQEKQGGLDLIGNELEEQEEQEGGVACKTEKQPTCLELADHLRQLDEEALGLADIEDDMLDDDVDELNFWGTVHQVKKKSIARLSEISTAKENTLSLMTEREASLALEKKKADRLKRVKLLKKQFEEKAAAALMEAERLKADSAVYDVLAAIPIRDSGHQPSSSSSSSSSNDSDDSSNRLQRERALKRRERTRTRSRSSDSHHTDSDRSRERRRRSRNTHSDHSRKSSVRRGDRDRDRDKDRDKGLDRSRYRKWSRDNDRGKDEGKIKSDRSHRETQRDKEKRKEDRHSHKHRHRSRERSPDRRKGTYSSRENEKDSGKDKEKLKGKEEFRRNEGEAVSRGRKRNHISSPSSSPSPTPSHHALGSIVRKIPASEPSSSSSSALDFKDKIRVALGVEPLKAALSSASIAVPFRDKIQMALDALKE